MVKDLEAAVFPDREIRMMVAKEGSRDAGEGRGVG
jgi:hypothetical protein